MEWNERQLIALEALVAELVAGPLWERPGHCDEFWKREAELKRLERKSRETQNETEN